MKYCGKCEAGIIRSDKGFARCECVRHLFVQKIFKGSKTPEKYFKYATELDDQQMFSSLEEAVSYKSLLEGFSKPENIDEMIEKKARIVLKGSIGSGKTQFATSLALEIVKQFDLYAKTIQTKSMYFLYAKDLGRIMHNEEKKAVVIEEATKSDVLILDDLGTEPYKVRASLETLDEIVRKHEGIIIITTNLDDRCELRNFYAQHNERLADVLFPGLEAEHGETNCLYYYIVRGAGDSRRKQKMKLSF